MLPGAEGRTGWPWDGWHWQFNWGLLILELAPFLITLFIIVYGVLSNKFHLPKKHRFTSMEDFAGTVQASYEKASYFIIGFWIIIAVAVLLYMINNAIYGELY